MSSELLAAGTSRHSAGPAPAALRVSERFDPYLAGGEPPGERGARQAAWTLAEMLRRPIRDLMASAAEPLQVVLVGAAEGWLALQLLAWGVETVSVVDPSAQRRERVLRLAEATAADPAGTALRSAPSLAGAGRSGWSLAVLDARTGMAGSGPGAIEAAGERSAVLAVLTDDRGEARRRLREAGLEAIELIQPPLDAERRFIRLERALLIGRRAGER